MMVYDIERGPAQKQHFNNPYVNKCQAPFHILAYKKTMIVIYRLTLPTNVSYLCTQKTILVMHNLTIAKKRFIYMHTKTNQKILRMMHRNMRNTAQVLHAFITSLPV